MLNYARQFFKIRAVFHMLYLWNEVGEPHFFPNISDTSNSFSDCSKNYKKKRRLENFRANFLNSDLVRLFAIHFVVTQFTVHRNVSQPA